MESLHNYDLSEEEQFTIKMLRDGFIDHNSKSILFFDGTTSLSVNEAINEITNHTKKGGQLIQIFSKKNLETGKEIAEEFRTNRNNRLQEFFQQFQNIFN